ncbi:MAG: hypothetical protein EXR43_04910 [Dehalococcoidia bacterium]|nr:hypothetical protein [Dehalococcoidia bacterium]
MTAAQLMRLARLIGREEFRAALPVPEGTPELDAGQRARLALLIDERQDAVAGTLVEEAAASDDVVDSASASAFAADRLAELDDLLTPGQRDTILARFDTLTAGWDSE